MNSSDLLLPIAALAIWTLMVLLLLPYRRFKAAAAGQVTVDDFKFGESARVPPEVSIPNRHVMNLLEMPVLFYVACLTLVVAAKVDPMYVTLAWTFFALRVIHSVVHLTYNNVNHRLAVFATSNLVLTVIWVRLLVQLA